RWRSAARSPHRRRGGPSGPSRLSCQRLERRTPAITPPLQPADHGHRNPGFEPVPTGRIVNDVRAIERGAEHGGLGDLAAIAAADAGIVDRRNGIVAQGVVQLLHRKRRAAREADASMVAGADVLVDTEALLDGA